MAEIPGPRTYPTVKQSVSMNKKSIRYFELKLGILQLTVLLGAVLGSLVCAFALGYFSGQKIGFEHALASNEASLARLPVGVPSKSKNDSNDGELSDVYAKLSEKAGEGLAKNPGAKNAEKGESNKKDQGMPELGTIKEADGATLSKPAADLQLAKSDSSQPPIDQSKGLNDVKNEKTGEAENDIDALLDSSAADLEHAKEGTVVKQGNAVVKVLGEPVQAAEKDKKSASTKNSLGALLENQVAKSDSSNSKTESAGEKLNPAEKSASLTELSGSKTDDSAKLSKKEKTESDAAQAKLVKEEHQKKAALEKEASKSKAESSKMELVKDSKNAKKINLNGSSAVGRGWFAQVAAPKKKSDADSIASRLKASGFQVSIETADVRGEEYYRVLVGPEDNRAQADRLVSQLSRENYIQGVPFIRMIK